MRIKLTTEIAFTPWPHSEHRPCRRSGKTLHRTSRAGSCCSLATPRVDSPCEGCWRSLGRGREEGPKGFLKGRLGLGGNHRTDSCRTQSRAIHGKFCAEEGSGCSSPRKIPSRIRRSTLHRSSRHDSSLFHANHAELADRLARAVTEHATPVGSGTVARTKRIPVEQRAEAAVIAWMRHQTTGYDGMAIPRVKGKRREVRRMLARRSHELLGQRLSVEGRANLRGAAR